jgi:hypothetical protein
MTKKKVIKKLERAHRQLCADLKMMHQVNDKEAGRQEAKGDSAGAAESARQAEAAKADAAKWGCGWAQ